MRICHAEWKAVNGTHHSSSAQSSVHPSSCMRLSCLTISLLAMLAPSSCGCPPQAARRRWSKVQRACWKSPLRYCASDPGWGSRRIGSEMWIKSVCKMGIWNNNSPVSVRQPHSLPVWLYPDFDHPVIRHCAEQGTRYGVEGLTVGFEEVGQDTSEMWGSGGPNYDWECAII